jgi:hypothetical protein
MGHCLELGGQHTEPKHFSLIMVCAEICRTSAHVMLIGSWTLAATAPKVARRWLPEFAVTILPRGTQSWLRLFEQFSANDIKWRSAGSLSFFGCRVLVFEYLNKGPKQPILKTLQDTLAAR